MSPRMVNWLPRLAARMHVRGSFIAAIIAFLIFAGIVIYFRLDSEPSYERLSASEWLELVSTNQQKMPEAITAFRAMGPKGAEFLGERLLRKTNSIDTWLLAHHQQIPGPLKKTLLKPQHQAIDGTILKLLSYSGTNAAPVIPAVITWLENQSTKVYVPYTNPIQTKPIAVTATPRPLVMISNGVRITNMIYLYPGSPPTVLFSNPYVSRTPPNLITQVIVAVSSPGNVTTNTNVLIKVASVPMPKLVFQMLTNLGSDDARVVPLLLNRVEGITFYGPPPLGPSLSRAARRAVPLLVQSTHGPNDERRWMALSLLSLTLPQSRVARETLTKALLDTNRPVFDSTITALQNVTNDLDIIVPIATGSLLRMRNRTTDLYGGWNPPVYQALENFSHHTPLVASQLQEILPQADFYEQVGILQLFSRIGTPETMDKDLLTSFSTNSRPIVASAALLALGNIYGDKVAEASAHIKLLEIGNTDNAWRSYEKLGELGPDARTAVPLLITHLKLARTQAVQQAAETLGKIGPAAQDAIEPLQALHSHPDATVRETAEAAIRLITASAPQK